MTLLELINIVGPDNIRIQKLDDCVTVASARTKPERGVTLTFFTREITVSEVAQGTGKYGLVVWIPRELMPP